MKKKYIFDNQRFLVSLSPKGKKCHTQQSKIFGRTFLNKKCISPVVAIALLLIVTVVTVTSYQGWFSNFSSKIFTSVETQGDQSVGDGTVTIERIVGNDLYILNNDEDELEIISLKIGNYTYSLTDNLSLGINELNISECIDNLTTTTPDIVLITPHTVVTKKVLVTNIGSGSSSGGSEEEEGSSPPAGFIELTTPDNYESYDSADWDGTAYNGSDIWFYPGFDDNSYTYNLSAIGAVPGSAVVLDSNFTYSYIDAINIDYEYVSGSSTQTLYAELGERYGQAFLDEDYVSGTTLELNYTIARLEYFGLSNNVADGTKIKINHIYVRPVTEGTLDVTDIENFDFIGPYYDGVGYAAGGSVAWDGSEWTFTLTGESAYLILGNRSVMNLWKTYDSNTGYPYPHSPALQHPDLINYVEIEYTSSVPTLDVYLYHTKSGGELTATNSDEYQGWGTLTSEAGVRTTRRIFVDGYWDNGGDFDYYTDQGYNRISAIKILSTPTTATLVIHSIKFITTNPVDLS